MKPKNKQHEGVKHLRKWFKTLTSYQFNERWISDPIFHRASRPKILGAETEREKRTNDLLCARFAGREKK